ncbi:universal stress protein [Congregibacter litoralis]|uniref:Universal stress protein UspA n=1 Tax=Congregibacter litoralis KT71 TaxID=314285 RepID=A4ACB7_9GAMM|nr:universal stress protein [Congregibacter litoralis]EAQ96345.1 Universal stress protein UspA [Congregibacter litoralis KT71]
MKQFRDILVYAESDDQGCLEQVVAVAKAHSAAITVCEVVEPAPQMQDNRGVIERVSKLRWSRAFQRLRRICDLFASHTVIDYSVFTGVPFVTITEQVVQQDFDLVVHISEPVQMASGIGLNATGMHLMRKCPCTVWALHPERERHSSDVVLALDRELASGTRAAEAFAMTLADAALGLAQTRDGNVHVLHAWQAYGAELLDDPELELTDSERQVYRRQQQGDSEQWFKRIVQRIESIADDPVRVKAHLIEGMAVPTVEELVERTDSGMLVLGTVGTSANPGVLIGATTESILAGGNIPVLALKPPGFVSPLMLARQA